MYQNQNKRLLCYVGIAIITVVILILNTQIMELNQIIKMPTVIDNKHESLYQSCQILEKVIEMLKRNKILVRDINSLE